MAVRASRAVLRNTPSRRGPRGNPLITSTIRGRGGRHGTNLREKERLSRLPSRTSVRACARTRARGGAREKRRGRERKGEKEEGVGTLRRSFDEEARQSSSTRENAFCPPTPGLSVSLSLSRSPWPSQPLQSCGLSLSLSPCPPAGATGRVSPWAQPGPRATSHGPRGPARYNIQHATTRYRHLLFPPSHSRALLLGPFLGFIHSLALSLSSSLRCTHTTRTTEPGVDTGGGRGYGGPDRKQSP